MMHGETRVVRHRDPVLANYCHINPCVPDRLSSRMRSVHFRPAPWTIFGQQTAFGVVSGVTLAVPSKSSAKTPGRGGVRVRFRAADDFLFVPLGGKQPKARCCSAANRSGTPRKMYLLPRSYLVKEDLTTSRRMGCSYPTCSPFVFLLFFRSRKGYTSPAFTREVLWLSGPRNGARGLLVKSAT